MLFYRNSLSYAVVQGGHEGADVFAQFPAFVGVGHVAVRSEGGGKGVGEDFRLVQRADVEVNAGLPQVILRAGRAHAAACAHDGRVFSRQHGSRRAGGPVQSVFQRRSHGIVVFRHGQHKGVGLLHLFDERKDAGRRFHSFDIEGKRRQIGDVQTTVRRQNARGAAQKPHVAGGGAQTSTDAEKGFHTRLLA